MKFTETSIRNYRLPSGVAKADEYDHELKGFVVRFRTSGAHAFYVVYGPRGRRVWVKVGDVSALALNQARTAAREILAKVALGHDPAREKAQARIESAKTFGALTETYLAYARNALRERTVGEIQRYLNDAKPLYRLGVKGIDRSAIAALLADIETKRGRGARNNMRNYVSGFFGWMRGEGFVDINPVLATNTAARQSRDRLLTDAEVRVIHAALQGTQRVDADFRAIVRLLFLTGLRRDEVARLEWDEIDLDHAAIIVSGSRTKNHKDHVAPLSSVALAILKERHGRLDPSDLLTTVFGRRDSGFSGFSKAKRELDEAITAANGGKPIEWVLHDIRRYVSTTLNERLGVAPHIVEVILSHYPKGVAGTYNRGQYVVEKRRALDKLADHLRRITSGEAATTKVVNLSKRVH